MKNKKLFAILTLVCFMFTLMPVAAFAAAPTAVLTDAKLYNDGTKAGVSFDVESITGIAADKEFEVKVELYAGTEKLTTLTRDFKGLTALTATVLTKGTHDKWEMTPWVACDTVVPTKAILYLDGEKVAENTNFAVVAAGWTGFAGVVNTATAGNIDDATSTFVAEDGDQSVKIGEDVVFELDVEDKTYGPAAGTVFIWAEETAGKASSALNIVTAGATEVMNNVWAIVVHDYADVKVDFARAGEYTVYAAPAVNVTNVDTNEVAELSKFDCDFSVITVKGGSVDPELAYRANGYVADKTIDSVKVTPNNVFEEEVEVVFTVDGQPMKGKTIAIETNSASIEVSKASDKTDSQGEIDFAIAGSVEGDYEVILSVDGVEWVIAVTVGNTDAAYIENVKAPKAPVALYDALAADDIEFSITDINGNVVDDTVVVDDNGTATTTDDVIVDANGMDGIYGINGLDVEKYVVLTKAPADSDLESDDFRIAYVDGKKVWKLVTPAMDAEGTYAVKVILDNGAYATAEWTVKKFQTPVRLILGYATNTVELGSSTTAKLLYMDANGVQKLAKDADFAATGYAVANASGANGYGTVVVKSDEKYVGETIKVTAVSTKYDLVGNAVLTVAEEASEISFADAKAEVNVNNKLVWNVVDAAGNKVTLTNGVKATDIKYVVLDKPEGAKVSVGDATNPQDLNSKGEGKMTLVSNKVGTVKVQVVLKAEYAATADADKMQVKYYTGTVEVPVGMDTFKDVVVMSINSNQIVVNSDIKEMLCEAVIKDGRTFVPFRAGLEALGATVDYVNGQVIAEMNGVKVVMEAGKTAYTVNGVAKVADVAPYLNVEASTTMVPAKFVADAFGINYDYTTNPDGTVADVIFAN